MQLCPRNLLEEWDWGQLCPSVPAGLGCLSAILPQPTCGQGVCAIPGTVLGLFFHSCSLAGRLSASRSSELHGMRSCNRLCSVVTAFGAPEPFRKTLPS